jgi:hypothetical protein
MADISPNRYSAKNGKIKSPTKRQNSQMEQDSKDLL